MKKKPEKTPAHWKEGKRRYGAGLTLKIAKKMLDAAEQEAEKRGVPMVIAIADAGGNLLALRRMDNAILMSIQIAMDKSYAAVFGKLPTCEWKGMFQDGELIPLFVHERWITFPGGYPIVKNGVLVGGLGVSDGTVEDSHVAKAALQAGGFSTDEVDAFLARC